MYQLVVDNRYSKSYRKLFARLHDTEFTYTIPMDGNRAEDGIDLRACLKSSNEDGNEGKRENLSRNIKFAFTIFPKSAEFVEPAEKTLYHPAAWQNDKLV
jgi:hypothetical protein